MQIKVKNPDQALIDKITHYIDISYISSVTLNSKIKHISIDTYDLNFGHIGLIVHIINNHGYKSTIT